MIKSVHALQVGLCLCTAALQTAYAQSGVSRDPQMRVRPIGARDAVRSAMVTSEGERALARARAAMAAGQYDRAYAEFRSALNLLDATKAREREQARNGLAESGTRLAKERLKQGRRREGDSILQEVLAVRPNYRPARELQAQRDAPADGSAPATTTPYSVRGFTGPPPAPATGTPPSRRYKAEAAPPPPGASGQGAPPPQTLPQPVTRGPASSEPIYEGRVPAGGGPVKNGVPAGGSAPPSSTDVEPIRKPIVKVFFGTDRAASDETGPSNRFTSKRNRDGNNVLTGYVKVSIPPTHKPSEIERPWKFFTWEGKENEKKHIVLKELRRMSGDEFNTALHDELAQRPAASRSAFVFIHGYRVSFDEAAYRTAELAYDLNFPGVPIMYSWPAQSKLLTYAGDLDNAELSSSNLKEFLERVAQQSDATRIHLVAHSMGNKVLMGALEKIAVKNEAPHFDNVIMVAPDVNADYFKKIWPEIQPSAQRFTLYASSSDNALLTAMNLRGGSDFERLGQGGDNLVVLKGMDSIDASGIDTSLLGHSYEACKPVLKDVRLMFDKNLQPLDRELRNRLKNGLAYWVFP